MQRWLEPVTIALYPVMFERDPRRRAALVAADMAGRLPSGEAAAFLDDIDLVVREARARLAGGPR